MNPPPVILASRSAARSALLKGAGVPFTTADSGVDETILKTQILAEGGTPAAVAAALAREKALAISQSRPGLVIGADQTLDFEGRLHDKPSSLAEAADRLRAMRGKPHALHAAVALARDGEVVWETLDRRTCDARLHRRLPGSLPDRRGRRRPRLRRRLSARGSRRTALLRGPRRLFHHPRPSPHRPS